jgi:hypothetical protein
LVISYIPVEKNMETVKSNDSIRPGLLIETRKVPLEQNDPEPPLLNRLLSPLSPMPDIMESVLLTMSPGTLLFLPLIIYQPK